MTPRIYQTNNNLKLCEDDGQFTCLFCKRYGYYSDIKECIDDGENSENRSNFTAICPHCNVDCIEPGIRSFDYIMQRHHYLFNTIEFNIELHNKHVLNGVCYVYYGSDLVTNYLTNNLYDLRQ